MESRFVVAHLPSKNHVQKSKNVQDLPEEEKSRKIYDPKNRVVLQNRVVSKNLTNTTTTTTT